MRLLLEITFQSILLLASQEVLVIDELFAIHGRVILAYFFVLREEVIEIVDKVLCTLQAAS